MKGFTVLVMFGLGVMAVVGRAMAQVEPANMPPNSILGNPDPVRSGPGQGLSVGKGISISGGVLNCVICSGGAIQFVQPNGGASLPQEPIINFKNGTNITVTAVDNPGLNRIDVTINSPASGFPSVIATYDALNQSSTIAPQVLSNVTAGLYRVTFQIACNMAGTGDAQGHLTYTDANLGSAATGGSTTTTFTSGLSSTFAFLFRAAPGNVSFSISNYDPTGSYDVHVVLERLG